ncbi:hypothetical protein Y032_0499g2555 [Ancylostoma ceylanicum]|uniref:Uncharacterized protein n=1 Tax=Ancylostoma ceylanicum TaxID=53326 RepID=A0A016WU74_9BILA|nr:hypothetical protein Y032_0499g2555 [Ancylostoma ceylanicum]
MSVYECMRFVVNGHTHAILSSFSNFLNFLLFGNQTCLALKWRPQQWLLLLLSDLSNMLDYTRHAADFKVGNSSTSCVQPQIHSA